MSLLTWIINLFSKNTPAGSSAKTSPLSSNKIKLIDIHDYLGSTPYNSLTEEEKTNAHTLLSRVNELLSHFGEARVVTSGYRSKEQHKRVYEQINRKREAKGLPAVSIPWGSQHLKAAAVDLQDKDERLDVFCRENEALLEKLGLWIEDSTETLGWTHCQIYSPRSGKRYFKP